MSKIAKFVSIDCHRSGKNFHKKRFLKIIITQHLSTNVAVYTLKWNILLPKQFRIIRLKMHTLLQNKIQALVYF